ncbi:hypothetical protein [Psychromonas aquatilis]|uniref:Uncharacterized protein n=1 Tax=Psychromonas aquatilis TaxID=2005072 RepID=A0ABU9GPP3_9GAMM
MKTKLLLVTSTLLFALSMSQAAIINPDCDTSKVATSAAVKATTGVSGPCTAEKAAERAVDDKKDAVSDATEDAKKSIEEKTDNVNDNIDDKANDINDAKDNLDDIKKDPVKSLVN